MRVDEYEIIDLLKRSAGRLPNGFLAIGDDVAVIPSGSGRLVLKSDMLVAKTDVPPGMTWRQASRKSVAACVSDFAAKGVSPRAFLASIGIPGTLSKADLRSFAGGFRDATREWGVPFVGGDTNEADEVVIDCLMAGFADRIVERSGARPGELVVVSGEFGGASAGLKMLLEGAAADRSFGRRVLEKVYMPSPPLKTGLAVSRYLSSSMDSSDGLAICLHTIAEMSGVGIRLDSLPFESGMESFASTNGYAVSDLVLYGGEEYELVGTIGKDLIQVAKRAASSVGGKLLVIGETTDETGGVNLKGEEIGRVGWVHLRGP